MIKTYWKQLLVTAYIAIVLILSATVKAESVVYLTNIDDELSNLQDRIATLYSQSEPAVFAKPSFNPEDAKSLMIPFEDRGYFLFDNTTSKLVFVSDITNKIYYVKCETALRANIDSEKIYTVKGFSLSNNSSISVNGLDVRPPSQQQVSFLNPTNFIFVTGVEIQR